ncbi:MAG TPA: hypothetical protein DHN33_10690 [Eubacteriaceae bacterium]|nr:hypothetical protein [Eubacteriaceae bacterium]
MCPVEDVKIYEAVKTEESVEKKAVVEMLEKGELDYVTFTSSSTVDHLMEVLGEDKTKLTSATLASIGPITSKTLREYGFDRIVEAKRYDIDGLLQAIERTEREKDKGGSPHAK